MKSILLFVLSFLSLISYSQDVLNMDGVDCDTHGSSRPGSKTYYLNEFKNRYTIPASGDFDQTTGFQDLAQSADPNQFSQNKALKLSAYVWRLWHFTRPMLAGTRQDFGSSNVTKPARKA